jgi:hypothetical protein
MKDLVERFESVIETESLIKQDNRVSFFEMFTPAFVGGMIIGILAGVPGLSLLFFLFPIGGYIAASLVKDYYEKNINAKDAAKTGAFAGLIGGFFASMILLIFSIFLAEKVFIFFTMFLNAQDTVLIMTLSGIDPYVSLYNMRIRFLANVVICTFLGCIGGLIFAMRRKR